MDKITEFLKEFRERLSNPLFSSFLITWCIINWEITLGLFFYNITELNLDGYVSYKDLISNHLNPKDSLYLPLSYALLYTFIFPFVRNGVLAFNSWIKTWGDTWNLKITKEGKIPMTKYIDLLEESKKRNKLLDDTIANEERFKNENKQFGLDLQEAREEISKLKSDLQKWELSNAVSTLDGQWEFHSTTMLTQERIVHKISIHSGRIDFSSSTHINHEMIRHFHFDPRYDRIFLIIESYEQDGSGELRESISRFQTLEVLDDGKVLRGRENDKIQIEYKRIK